MDTDDFVQKTKTQMFFVYGYAQSGSGSLTFPEDFDFVGFFHSENEAQELVKKLNAKIREEEGLPQEGDDDYDEDDLEGIVMYEYQPMNSLILK